MEHEEHSVQAAISGCNDNGTMGLDNAMLLAAIKLFGEYGHSCAEQARTLAADSFWAGDSNGHKWWMAVLDILDSHNGDMSHLLASKPVSINDSLSNGHG